MRLNVDEPLPEKLQFYKESTQKLKIYEAVATWLKTSPWIVKNTNKA